LDGPVSKDRALQARFLLRLYLLGFTPRLVGIERRHTLDAGFGVFAEIPLINRAGVADDEGHDAGIAVVGGIGENTAQRTWRLPEIEAFKPFLTPELAVWATAEDGLVAGRADALVVRNQRVEVVIDWKSDVNVSPAVRAAHMQQLQKYIFATGAERGAIVFMTLGEIAWVKH
jgi:hypothetical protein